VSSYEQAAMVVYHLRNGNNEFVSLPETKSTFCVCGTVQTEYVSSRCLVRLVWWDSYIGDLK
jgi:hypothetical protein